MQRKLEEIQHDRDLLSARFDSTARATCQSSNKLGYSSGSAKESAAFVLTFNKVRVNVMRISPGHFK